jgi:hypothetical protein
MKTDSGSTSHRDVLVGVTSGLVTTLGAQALAQAQQTGAAGPPASMDAGSPMLEGGCSPSGELAPPGTFVSD